MSTRDDIIDCIREYPGITNKALTVMLGRPIQTITVHTSRALRDRSIRSEDYKDSDSHGQIQHHFYVMEGEQ